MLSERKELTAERLQPFTSTISCLVSNYSICWRKMTDISSAIIMENERFLGLDEYKKSAIFSNNTLKLS